MSEEDTTPNQDYEVADATPQPTQITGDQIVASIINLNQRLLILEDIHKKALRDATASNKYKSYRA
jgi:hypothetical protein